MTKETLHKMLADGEKEFGSLEAYINSLSDNEKSVLRAAIKEHRPQFVDNAREEYCRRLGHQY